MKDSYSKADVKNAKHSAIVGGLILGTLATVGIGILVKKTTKANIIDGSESLFDKGVSKVRDLIDSRKHNSDDEEK